MAIAPVASTIAGAASGASVTTTAQNTTGANLIVVSIAFYTGPGTGVTVTDSLSNTWTALTAHTSSNHQTRQYYCVNPTTGASHTFTLTGPSGFSPNISMIAVSGAAASPYESDTGANSGSSSVTTIQPGSLTPAENGDLLVSGLVSGNGASQAINDSFTAVVAGTGSGAVGGGLGYLIQATAAAINPTWTWTTGDTAAATLSVWKPNTSPLMTASPAAVVANSAGNTITLTGSVTAWTGSTTFSATAGTIVSQSVNTGTQVATLTYTAPAASQVVTFSDNTDSATAGVTVQIPMSDPNIYFSPGNWNLATPAAPVTPCCGAYLRPWFNGTGLVMGLNTTNLGANATYIEYSVDGGPWNQVNIAGLSSLTIATGLASGNHQVWIMYQGRTYTLDSWNNPSNGWRPTYIVITGGTGLTAAPTVLSKKMLVLGDSRIEGYDITGSTQAAQFNDAKYSTGFMLAEALGCELGLAAFGALGWTVGGQTNVPPLFTPGNDAQSSYDKIYSGVSRSLAGYDYICIPNMGGNDFRQSASAAAVEASVAGCLAAIRAANSTAVIIVVPSYEGDYQSFVQTGFNTYQASAPDVKCLFVDPGFSTAEKAAISSIPGGSQYATYLSNDGIHPSGYGQQVYGSKIVQAVQQALITLPTTGQVQSGVKFGFVQSETGTYAGGGGGTKRRATGDWKWR